MLILGLVLVVVSAAAGVLLIAYNHSGGPEQTVVLFGRDLAHVTPTQAFIAGMVVALVFCLGVWMVASVSRRRAAIRSDYRAVRREARTAAAERDKLARQLERERATEPEPAAVRTTEPVAPARPAEPVADGTEEPRGIGRYFRRGRHTAGTTTTSDK
jgi:heme exporter protein D